MAEVDEIAEMEDADDIESRLQALEAAEKSIGRAYTTGKVDRAQITQMAQLDAAEAVAMAGIAMESDEVADEAHRITVIAEHSGNREQAKAARKREREARKKANADHKAATKSAKQAYDAIKFSAPNKMGFLRAVQVIFAIHIASVLIYLVLTSRDAMTYDVTSMMDWVMVILEGVAFWMFMNRYKIAKPFVIAMAAIGLVVPVIYDVFTGHFNPFALSLNGVFYIFLIIYFAVSDRVKATLINDFAKHEGDYDKDSFVIERRGWPFIRNLIMYFIVFSILGHWMEMGMCQFIIMGLVQGEYDPSNTMLWRDWLYPFPMEGAAVVIIALVLYPLYTKMKQTFKNRLLPYVLSFLANALVCSIIEFSMGLLVNADLQLWDYSDMFGNIMGQVCLQNTMAFGVAASLIAWFVYPMMERGIARVPRDIMNIVFVVIAVFGAIVWSLYLINPPGVDEQNKHPEMAEQLALESRNEAAAAEMADLKHAAGLYPVSSTALRTLIDEAKHLDDEDKAKLRADIDALDTNISTLEADLAAIEAKQAAAAASALASITAASSAASGASASSAAASAASASSAAAQAASSEAAAPSAAAA